MMIISLVVIGTSFAAWCILNRKLFGDIFSPLNILYYGWVLPLLVRSLGLSSLESPWDFYTISVMVWATLALTATCFAASFDLRKYSTNNKSVFQSTLELLRNKRFLFLVGLSFVVAFVIYIYVEFLTNPASFILYRYFFTNSYEAGNALHRWGKDSKAAAVTGLLIILSPISYLGFRANTRLGIKLIWLVMALAYPFMGLMKLSKIDVIMPILECCFVEYYYNKYATQSGSKVAFPWFRYVIAILVIILVTVTVAYGMTAIRLGDGETSSTARYEQAIGFQIAAPPYIREPLALIYGYIVLNFENTHRFLHSYQGGYHIGISVFRPVLSMFAQGDIADAMIATINYDTVSSSANTSTFLSPVYAELGLAGLIFIPLLYGLLINFIYLRFRAKPDFTHLFVYISFCYPWFWLFGFNGFSVFTFYINAAFTIILIAAYRLLFKAKNQALEPPQP